ncbi:MAG: c-type cytochrome [Woeseiaceae bacterium]|nr:c-type cytochrome [Woeseiaceae bacterium]
MQNTTCERLLDMLLIALIAAPAVSAAAAPQGNTDTDTAAIERGRYIVNTSGCHDCHTPWIDGPSGPGPDMSRALSGHPETEKVAVPAMLPPPWVMAGTTTNTAYYGPWGVSFTANLTPDRETGLGKWSSKMFIETIRNGRHKGRGREILPPMPILVYRNFTDEDLAAIFAYLQTIPAVQNKVPEPLAPAEFVTSTD